MQSREKGERAERDRSILRFPRSTLKLFDTVVARRCRVFIGGEAFDIHTKPLCRSREERTHSEGEGREGKARLGTRAGRRTPKRSAGEGGRETRGWTERGKVELYPPKRACHSQAAESISLYSRINDNIIFQRSRRDAAAP